MSRTIRHSNRTPTVQPVNEALNDATPSAAAVGRGPTPPV
jgi:hypothetical protein